MKFWCLLACLAGIQAAMTVGAAVNMISIQHRVWGDAGEPPTTYYDVTDSVPLSRGISHEFYMASSLADLWSIHADRDGDSHFAKAYAQNTYVFKPISRQLTIMLGGQIAVWWFENDARMTLTNLNTASIVSSYQSPSYFYPQSPFADSDDMVDYPIRWDETVAVNPEHEYKLILFVGAHRGEGGHGSASLNLTLAPEPGVALLAGVAVLLMCARRQRID